VSARADGSAPFRIPPHAREAYLRSRFHFGMGVREAAAAARISRGTGYRIEALVTDGAIDPAAELSPRNGRADKGRAPRNPKVAASPAGPAPGVDLVVPEPLRPVDLGELARAALEDFGLFRSWYLGRVRSPWQEEAARRMVEYLTTPRREFVVVNAPPGPGKSTLFTHDLIVWMICRDRRIRVLVGSRSEKLAAKYTGRIRRTLSRLTPPIPPEASVKRGLAVPARGVLSLDYGRFAPLSTQRWGTQREVWSKLEMTVATLDEEAPTDKEATVTAFGFDTKKLGPRYDLIVWDDLVDARTARSMDASANLASDYEDEGETRLDPGGLLILQGQRLRANDLYRHCLDKLVPVMLDDTPGVDYDPGLVVGELAPGPGEEEEDENAPIYKEKVLPHDVEYGGIPVRLAGGPGAGELLGWRHKYHHVVYPAHFEDRCTGAHGRDAPAALDPERPGGCLLDPVRLPWYELMGHASANPTRFRVLYQQEDVDPEGVLVRHIWIDGGRDPATGEEYPGCWDTERGRGDIPHGAPLTARSVMSIDPSPSNWWAFQWWLYDPPTERQWLVDLVRRTAAAPDFVDWDYDGERWVGMLEEWWARSVRLGRRITHVIVEDNAAQRFLFAYAHVKRWSQERSVSVIPHNTGPIKTDPDRGPEILKSHYRFGRVRLPGNFAAGGREVSNPLVAEVTRYPDGTTDDQVMAQWFLNYQAARIWPKRQTENVTRLRRPSWLAADTEARVHPLFARSS
jgi:hypothetical protein